MWVLNKQKEKEKHLDSFLLKLKVHLDNFSLCHNLRKKIFLLNIQHQIGKPARLVVPYP